MCWSHKSICGYPQVNRPSPQSSLSQQPLYLKKQCSLSHLVKHCSSSCQHNLLAGWATAVGDSRSNTNWKSSPMPWRLQLHGGGWRPLRPEQAAFHVRSCQAPQPTAAAVGYTISSRSGTRRDSRSNINGRSRPMQWSRSQKHP